MILIIAEAEGLINFKSFQHAHIDESDGKYEILMSGIIDGANKDGAKIKICVITLDNKEDAEKALRSLRAGIRKGEWDAKEYKKSLVDPLKKVKLYLSDKLGDPETDKTLQMWGVELTGTSVQIGLIWECLRRFGEIDVTHPSELKILKKCEADLKKARETADAFELNDPDQE